MREAFALQVDRGDLTEKELVESDAVVLLADHDAFDFEMLEQHAPFILDTRARLHGPQVERL